MYKHKINKIVIFEGKTYLPANGIVTLPKIDKRYNPIEEVKEGKPDWKQLAVESGLEGEDLKKFMKKNAEQKQKQIDKLKG